MPTLAEIEAYLKDQADVDDRGLISIKSLAKALASQEEATYTVLTRENTVASLQTALTHYLTKVDGDQFPSRGVTNPAEQAFPFSVANAGNTLQQSRAGAQINNVWNVANQPPYIWTLAPSYFGRIRGISIRLAYRGSAGTGNTVLAPVTDLPITEDALTINGTKYDYTVYRLPAERYNDGDKVNSLFIQPSFSRSKLSAVEFGDA